MIGLEMAILKRR